MQNSKLIKPATSPKSPRCPECGSKKVINGVIGRKCAECGHVWTEDAAKEFKPAMVQK